MKQKFIVYYHHTILGDAVVKASSKVEAQAIMKKRMKKKGLIEAEVAKVMSEKEEKKLIVNREHMGGTNYGGR